MESFIPRYDIVKEELIKGKLIDAPKGCVNNHNKLQCNLFYQNIKENEGFHVCPNGLTAYVKHFDQAIYIFTCLRTKGYYDKAKHRKINGFDEGYNPTLDQNSTLKIVESCINEISVLNLKFKLTDYFQTLKHETVYWSGEIQNLSDSLVNAASGKKKDKSLYNISTKIYHFSRLIGFNFSRFDLLNDSLTTSTFDKVQERIHKRFYAMIRCLEPSAKEKSIFLHRHGESRASIRLNLETFDILPFVVIENAIKYSPKNENVDITFEESAKHILVTITSVGPVIEEVEYDKIFTKGYRGCHVIETKEKGSGIGLYLAKRVCDIHKIKYGVESRFNRNMGSKVLNDNKFYFEIPLETD